LRFLDALSIAGPLVAGGHDIGRAVGQHLAVFEVAVLQPGPLAVLHRRRHKALES